MKKLGTFDFTRSKAHYNWEKFFDGSVYELTQGVDYKTSNANFRNTAYCAAKRRGLKVRCHETETGIVIQAYRVDT